MTTATARDQLIEEAGSYVIVGEDHRDESIGEELIEPLLDEGNFSQLYLEALKRGNYQEQGERLKQEDKVFPYHYNSIKYDDIIDRALNAEVEIHGLTSSLDGNRSIQPWIDYMEETEDDSSLILVGKDHVDRWQGGGVNPIASDNRIDRHPPLSFTSPINVPANLVSLGVSPENITTVSTHFHKGDSPSDLRQRKDFPEGFAQSDEYQNIDYLLLTEEVTS